MAGDEPQQFDGFDEYDENPDGDVFLGEIEMDADVEVEDEPLAEAESTNNAFDFNHSLFNFFNHINLAELLLYYSEVPWIMFGVIA